MGRPKEALGSCGIRSRAPSGAILPSVPCRMPRGESPPSGALHGGGALSQGSLRSPWATVRTPLAGLRAGVRKHSAHLWARLSPAGEGERHDKRDARRDGRVPLSNCTQHRGTGVLPVAHRLEDCAAGRGRTSSVRGAIATCRPQDAKTGWAARRPQGNDATLPKVWHHSLRLRRGASVGLADQGAPRPYCIEHRGTGILPVVHRLEACATGPGGTFLLRAAMVRY